MSNMSAIELKEKKYIEAVDHFLKPLTIDLRENSISFNNIEDFKRYVGIKKDDNNYDKIYEFLLQKRI